MWGPPEDPCLWAGDRKPALGLTLQWTHFQAMGASGALHLKGGAQDISNFKARLDSGTEARPLEVMPGGALPTSIPRARLPTLGLPASARQGGCLGTRDTRLMGAEPGHTAAGPNEAGVLCTRLQWSSLSQQFQILGLRIESGLLEHCVPGALPSVCRAQLDMNTAF